MVSFRRLLCILVPLAFFLVYISSSGPKAFEELAFASVVESGEVAAVTILDEAIPENPSVVYMDCYNTAGRLLVPLGEAMSALTMAPPSGAVAGIESTDILGAPHVWLRPLAELLGYSVRWVGEGIVELTSPGVVLRLVMNSLELPDNRASVPGDVSVQPLPNEGLTELQPSMKPVAITFDDGPNPHCTPAILSVLSQYGAKATFFCIAKEASRDPSLVRDIALSGHEIGNHTLSHRDLTTLGRSELATELTSSKAVLEALSGVSVRYVRPPFGKYSDAVKVLAADSGQDVVLWDVDPRDWDHADVPAIVSRVLSKVKAGDVVLLHERPETVLALPQILRALTVRGLQSVTISSLAAWSRLR